MKPRTKGQLPPGLQSLASLPFALCSIGVASVAALTDMGPAKFHEKCLDKDLRHGMGVFGISWRFR